MKNSWLAKIMFQREGTGFHLIGLDLSHLNSFHVSVILGMPVIILDLSLGSLLCLMSKDSFTKILMLLHRVKPEILKNVGKAITSLPENFKPHRAVKKVYDQRAQMIETGEGIDWALGEALAFATLVIEGNHVRLSGQDVERGTFSHRHSVVHHQETGEKYCPLDHLIMNQDEEMFTVSNR